MQSFQRIFGCGPRGVVISLSTLAGTWWLTPLIDLPPIHGNAQLGLSVLIASILITAAGLVWSLKSLPVAARGRELVTSGAFRFARHPLYASFLWSFDFGLAVYFDNWIYIAWAALQFPLWSLNVASEERQVRETFSEDYTAYCRKTGRFAPRLFRS